MKSFLRNFIPEYYRIKKTIKKHIIDKTSISYSDLLSDIEEIIINIKLKEKIISTQESITNPLSTLWKKTDTHTKVAIFAIEWLIKYRNSRYSKNDDEKLSKYIINSDSVPGNLIELKTIIENKIPVFIKHIDNLNRFLKVINKVVYSSGIKETLFNNINDKLRSWELNIGGNSI